MDRESREAGSFDRADEATLRAILDSTLDPVVTIGSDGTIRAASESVLRVFGWTPGELVGRDINVLMPTPHRDLHDGYLDRYHRTGLTSILGRTRELEGIRRDGAVFPLEISVSRVDVPGASEPLFTGIIHDISERKRTEQEFQLLHRLMLIVGTAKDIDTALAGALEQICAATGWACGEAWIPAPDGRTLGERPITFCRDPRVELFRSSSHETNFARGQGLPGRVWESKRAEWLADLSDERLFVRSRIAKEVGLEAALGVPILSQGDVVAVLAFFMGDRRDEDQRLMDLVSTAIAPLGPMIQRRRASAALAESERRLREMLASVELVAVTVDRAGVIDFCNDYLLRLTGWTREEIDGRDWFSHFVPADHAVEARQRVDEALGTGRIAPHDESEIVTRDGEHRVIAWNHMLLRDPGGAVIGMTSVGVDITDQRRNEQELAKHQQQLERLVAERTRELEATHEQLRIADRLASIGTLAAGLGHDMNNVLLPIRSRLDALDATSLPAEAREHIDAVRKSTAYLQQVADALHLLVLDPDDPEASTAETSLPSWWKQVGPLLGRSLPRHVRMTTDWPEDLPTVGVSPHRLTQAVLNLLVNAGEAVDEQGHVHVAAAPSPGGRELVLSVTDDGHGMAPEVRERALDPFFTTKKRGLGTGLGLALVRAMARSAGGKVEIDSEPGRGTTVRLLLPVRSPHATDGDAPGDGIDVSATITLRDRRTASLVSVLLETAGATVSYDDGGGGPSSCILWITEPTPAALRNAQRFVAEPRRRVIAIGPASRAWTDLGAVVIENPDDFERIRSGIDEAMTSLAESAT